MLVGEHGRPLGVRQKIDNADVLKKSDRFREQHLDNAGSGQYRQEAAAQQQPLDQHFLELDDLIFLQHGPGRQTSKREDILFHKACQAGLVFTLR